MSKRRPCKTRGSVATAEWTKRPGHNQELLAERLSARCGRRIRQGTVSFVSRGVQWPTIDVVLALEAECQIPAAWWTQPIAEEQEDPVDALAAGHGVAP